MKKPHPPPPPNQKQTPSILLLFFLSLSLSLSTSKGEYRSFDGYNNNLHHPAWGAAPHFQVRRGGYLYENGISDPVEKESSRLISNVLFSDKPSHPFSRNSVSDMHTFWGQFLDHDITLSPDGGEPFAIPVPKNDKLFNPNEEEDVFIPFTRTFVEDDHHPRNQPVVVTAFVDASQVYGSDKDRIETLRDPQNRHLLLLEELENVGEMLPKNTFGLPNANPVRNNPQNLFVAGDIRCNENPMLTSLHVLFAREHNRRAKILKQSNPEMEDDTIFQEARKWVGALMASVTFNEYVPVTIGGNFPAYTAYDDSVNAGIMASFSSCAFRYGHSEINTLMMRLGEDWEPIESGHLLFRDVYFRPSAWIGDGLESLVRGAVSQMQQEVDLFYVEDVRNFLFGLPGRGGIDLGAYSIQRGRDHGVSSYNHLRSIFNLSPATSFSDVSSNPTIQSNLAKVYENVDEIDAFVGGLAEDKPAGSHLGPLFQAIIREQYLNLRNGDRFYYKNTKVSGFTEEEVDEIDNTKLSHIILRNSNIERIQCDVFHVNDFKDCGIGEDGEIVVFEETPPPDTATPSLIINDGDASLSWNIGSSSSLLNLSFSVKNKGEGWISLGFPSTPRTMVGANAIVGQPQINANEVGPYHLGGKSKCDGGSGVCPTDDFTEGGPKMFVRDGATTIEFLYELPSSQQESLPIIYAYGVSASMERPHTRGWYTIDLSHDGCEPVTTISPVGDSSLLSAHGGFMIVAFLILFPIGIFFAAFGKGLGHLWMTIHVTCQIAALTMVMMGLMFILVFVTQQGSDHFAYAHGGFGLFLIIGTYIVMALGATAANMYNPQREGPPLFPDQIHRYAALAVMVLAFINVLGGIYLRDDLTDDGPSLLGWFVLIAYLFGLGFVYVLLYVKGFQFGGQEEKEEEGEEPEGKY